MLYYQYKICALCHAAEGGFDLIRIWGVLRKGQKLYKDITVESSGNTLADIKEAAGEICRALDIPRPIWLNKHENHMERFGRAVFMADDFMEVVPFERFELEILRDKGKSKDPRNDFSL